MNSALQTCCFTETEWLFLSVRYGVGFSTDLLTASSGSWISLSSLEWPIIYQLIIKGFTKSLCQRPKGQYPETSALLPLSLGGELYVAFGSWSNLSMWEASASHPWTQDIREDCKWLSAIIWLILSRKLSVRLLTAPISSAIQPL